MCPVGRLIIVEDEMLDPELAVMIEEMGQEPLLVVDHAEDEGAARLLRPLHITDLHWNSLEAGTAS